MSKVMRCAASIGLTAIMVFAFVGCSKERPDLNVTKTRDTIRIINHGETPVQIQEIRYNGGRCKPTTQEECDDFEKNILHKNNMTAEEYLKTTIYQTVCNQERTRVALPKTLQQGDTMNDFTPKNGDKSCNTMEIIEVAIVTDHGTVTYTWK